MKNNIIAYLTEQGNILNDYRKKLTKAIEEIEQILANDTVFSIYAFFYNGKISQLMLANNIEKSKKLLKQYRDCLQIIAEDEKERQEVIKSGFEVSLVNSYYENSFIRNHELIRYLS